ncbi:MAG: thioesterase [Chloroflexi bacterium]|nr:thioesterase [Chloroflexota bacterium]
MPNAPWVMRSKPQPRLRLFCFPYAGGGASIFRLWSNKLPSEVEVCPVYLPGREIRLREPLFTRLSPLVETLSHALSPYMDIPFAFFGHSMGALISFELTRHLRKKRKPGPAHLFVAALRAPQLLLSDSAQHLLPDPDFIDTLHRLGGTPGAVLQNEELMRLMLPILRADFAVYETYVYTEDAPLDMGITAFGGEQDHEVSVQDMAAWRTQTRSSFELHILPGNHFFIHSGQDFLLQILSQDLAKLLSRATTDSL